MPTPLAGLALAFLRRHQRLLVAFGLVTPIVAGAASFLIPVEYTATLTLTPATADRGVQLPAGLGSAAQALGMSLGGSTQRSPQFYAQVLTGRGLLRQVLLDSFPVPDSSGRATLLDLMDISGGDLEERLDKGERALRRRLAVNADARNTGILGLSLEVPGRELSAQAAERLVQHLNELLLSARRRDAGNRRRFLESRADSSLAELRRREVALQLFYERNRSFRDAPELMLRESALRREVDIAQTLYLGIAREAEAARVEEANDAPAVNVIDPPVPPQRKSRPQRSQIVGLGLLLGLVAGVATGLALDLRAGRLGSPS